MSTDQESANSQREGGVGATQEGRGMGQGAGEGAKAAIAGGVAKKGGKREL